MITLSVFLLVSPVTYFFVFMSVLLHCCLCIYSVSGHNLGVVILSLLQRIVWHTVPYLFILCYLSFVSIYDLGEKNALIYVLNCTV